MNVLENLATSLNRRDEVPNTELAVKISKKMIIHLLKYWLKTSIKRTRT